MLLASLREKLLDTLPQVVVNVSVSSSVPLERVEEHLQREISGAITC